MKNSINPNYRGKSAKGKISNFSKLKIVLSFVGLVLLGVVIVWISYYGIGKKNGRKIELGQYVVGDGRAFFDIDTQDKSYKKGEVNYFIVKLDTNGSSVNTVDFVLKFDSSKIEIDKNATKVEIFDTTKKTLNADSGIFEINAGSDGNNMFKTYLTSGVKTFAVIPFKLKSTSNTSVEFLCTDGVTTDSNIAVLDKDVINCNVNRKVDIKNIADDTLPEVTPTPSPTPNSGTGGGNNQNLSNEGSKPKVEPWCKKTPPSRPINLQAITTGKSGQVHLTWSRVSEEVTHYTVTYGTKWMDFDYGQPNIGNTDQFLVNGLANSKAYFFVITAVNDCASSGYSDGATAYAGWAPGSGTSSNSSYSKNNQNYGNGTTNNTYDKGYEIDPSSYDLSDEIATEAAEASDSSDYNYDSSNFGDENDNTNDVIITPEPSIEPYVPDKESDNKNNLSKALPLIGLVVLALLGILFIVLTKFAKKDVNE